jgi:hypothetical protein
MFFRLIGCKTDELIKDALEDYETSGPNIIQAIAKINPDAVIPNVVAKTVHSIKGNDAFGVLWGSLEFSEVLWNSLEFPGVFWGFLEFLGISWSSLEFPGVSWSFLEFPGVPRSSQEFPGVPRSSQEFPGVPWISLEFLGILSFSHRN